MKTTTAKTILQVFCVQLAVICTACSSLQRDVELNVEQIQPIQPKNPGNSATFAELLEIPLLPETLPPRTEEFEVPRPKPMANQVKVSETKEVSLAAAQRAKLTLVELAYDGNGSPVLRMDVDFHYAWPLVQNAITNAKISLIDLNRSLAIFYINNFINQQQTASFHTPLAQQAPQPQWQVNMDVLAGVQQMNQFRRRQQQEHNLNLQQHQQIPSSLTFQTQDCSQLPPPPPAIVTSPQQVLQLLTQHRQMLTKTAARGAQSTLQQQASLFNPLQQPQANHHVSAELRATTNGKEATFPLKLHEILRNEAFHEYITWNPNGKSWRMLKPALFEKVVIPIYFRCVFSEFTSFPHIFQTHQVCFLYAASQWLGIQAYRFWSRAK